MTGQDLSRLDSGDALVTYLAQPDASPTVCDLNAAGPHMLRIDDDVRESLVRGLVDGRIAPRVWRGCVDAVLSSASVPGASMVLDSIGRGYRSLIKSKDFETSPALQERLSAMQALYLERPNGLDGAAKVVSPMFDELRRAIDQRRLGPVATRFGEELLATVELEQGRYLGRPVDVATIDDLEARRDDATLGRFVERLPSKELRDEARRRILRMRIAVSPYAEVREHAAEVEERVMKEGANVVALEGAPPSAWFDREKIAAHGVLVRQDVMNQTAKLFGYADQRPDLSVLPELPLGGALWMDVPGHSRPITLCQPASAIDPTPCVAATDVRIDNSLAYLDRGGAFHFVDHVGEKTVVDLARVHAFTLPVAVGGHRVASLEWPLHFELPQSMVFSPSRGSNGPNLYVSVDRADPTRFIFAVQSAGETYDAVVEAGNLAGFRITSRGAAGSSGASGTSGSDGMSGSDGASASCFGGSAGSGSNGGDGGNGGPGEDGGPGGDGGNIQVDADCGANGCPSDVLALLRGVITSEGGRGGAGGFGGRGGHGGRGGSGGSGASCTDNQGNVSSVSGGGSGMDGHDGSSGPDGRNGSSGRPGVVRLRVVHAA
jgi:hypothetical protein